MNSLIRNLFRRLVKFLSKDELRALDGAICAELIGSKIESSKNASYYYWENQADDWADIPSPIRPSRNDIEIYKKLLEKNGPAHKILLLGSTPELRDLIAKERRNKLIIADFSYSMILKMLQFTRVTDPARETWIKTDWLELPIESGTVDIILGDLVLQQIPPTLESLFLKKMSVLLHDDGAFIGRFNFLNEKLRSQTIDILATKILNNNLLTYWQKFYSLKLGILQLNASPHKRSWERSMSLNMLREFMHKNKIDHPILGKVSKVLADEVNSYRSWSVPEENELVRIISQNFSIVERDSADDYAEASTYPIFYLKPRKSLHDS